MKKTAKCDRTSIAENKRVLTFAHGRKNWISKFSDSEVEEKSLQNVLLCLS